MNRLICLHATVGVSAVNTTFNFGWNIHRLYLFLCYFTFVLTLYYIFIHVIWWPHGFFLIVSFLQIDVIKTSSLIDSWRVLLLSFTYTCIYCYSKRLNRLWKNMQMNWNLLSIFCLLFSNFLMLLACYRSHSKFEFFYRLTYLLKCKLFPLLYIDVWIRRGGRGGMRNYWIFETSLN